MSAPFNPPKKNEDFKIRVCLKDMAVNGRFKANPTIAAGDFKVTTDAGGFGNLATLPTVSPAAGKAVLIELSAGEMNGDVITVVWSDQTDPPEWADGFISIPTTQ